MIWTPERTDALRRHHREGLSFAQIAALLGGVTRNACIGKAHRIGLFRGYSPLHRAKHTPAVNASPPKREAPPTRATLQARSKAFKPEPIPMRKPVLLSGQEKVWTERGPFECSWIVAGEGADSLACCAKVHARGWCAFHYQLGTLKPEPAPRRKRVVREPTFYDAEAA